MSGVEGALAEPLRERECEPEENTGEDEVGGWRDRLVEVGFAEVSVDDCPGFGGSRQ